MAICKVECLDAADSATPKPNVRNDFDTIKVRKEIETAKQSLKQVQTRQTGVHAFNVTNVDIYKKTANSLSEANNYGSRLTASGKLDIKIPQKFCPLNNYLHFCGAGGFPFRNPPVPLFM